MEINRFKEIIQYSNDNKEWMESKVKDFYVRIGMNRDKELLNIMQIVRPLFQKEGQNIYLILLESIMV